MTLSLTAPLDGLTPCELVDGRWYKRDDVLAFSNSVNGKVRTSIYLMDRAVAEGHSGVVYGGSVLAPALGRVASAAAYRGLKCMIVIGSKPETALRHPTVAVAGLAGAEFLTAKVAYNPALQKMARETAEMLDYFQVPYGVSTPASWHDTDVAKFLTVDAPQVDCLPDGLETLVIPFGSGNSAAAVLYGLITRGGPASLHRVVLVGVGPDRWPWLVDRLNHVGVDLTGQLPFAIDKLPLHPHFAEYSDRMPETQDGIEFHEIYEGKVVRFLDTIKPSWWTARDGTTCLWIVGGPLR